MYGGDAQSLHRETMCQRAVPLVFPKLIALILQIELTHVRVTRSLCQDRRGRNAQTDHIAFHERGL